MMHGHEKSDPAIVAVKLAKIANSPVAHCAGEPAVAEPVEPRAGTKGNAGQQSTYRTQSCMCSGTTSPTSGGVR